MFRSLQFGEVPLPYTMDPPLSVTLLAEERTREHSPIQLLLTPEDIFTTAVGHPSKRTLAKWHVTSPLEAVAELLNLVGIHKEGDARL
jgi:trehalose 6-phosphate synthase/phosphatase